MARKSGLSGGEARSARRLVDTEWAAELTAEAVVTIVSGKEDRTDTFASATLASEFAVTE